MDAGTGSIILSDLIRIDSVLSLFSFSLLQSIHNFTSEMQFCIRWTVVSKMVWKARNKKLNIVSKKIDWRLSDVRSSLKVVLCTKWINQCQRQSPAARQSREWMVLSCCFWWSPFLPLYCERLRTPLHSCVCQWHNESSLQIWQVCTANLIEQSSFALT